MPQGNLSAVKKPQPAQLCLESGAGSVYSKERRNDSDSGLTQVSLVAPHTVPTEPSARRDIVPDPLYKKLRRVSADISNSPANLFTNLPLVRELCNCKVKGLATAERCKLLPIGGITGSTWVIENHGRATLGVIGGPRCEAGVIWIAIPCE